MKGIKKPIATVKGMQIEGFAEKSALNPKRKKKLSKSKSYGKKRR